MPQHALHEPQLASEGLYRISTSVTKAPFLGVRIREGPSIDYYGGGGGGASMGLFRSLHLVAPGTSVIRTDRNFSGVCKVQLSTLRLFVQLSLVRPPYRQPWRVGEPDVDSNHQLGAL